MRSDGMSSFLEREARLDELTEEGEAIANQQQGGRGGPSVESSCGANVTPRRTGGTLLSRRRSWGGRVTRRL